MLRALVLVLGLLVIATTLGGAFARDTYVNGYNRKDGTYVAPHYRSAPNGTTLDNYSTRGNVNPYTGRAGTRDPYEGYGSYTQPRAPAYSPPRYDRSDSLRPRTYETPATRTEPLGSYSNPPASSYGRGLFELR